VEHAVAGADVGGGGEVVAFVDVWAAAGADGVEDEAWGFFGFGSGGGLGFCGLLRLAVHDALTVEKELGDVGEGGGVAAGDAVVGKVFEEIGEEEVDGGGLREVIGAGEEIYRDSLSLGYGFSFGLFAKLGAGVMIAEGWVMGAMSMWQRRSSCPRCWHCDSGLSLRGIGCPLSVGCERFGGSEWKWYFWAWALCSRGRRHARPPASAHPSAGDSCAGQSRRDDQSQLFSLGARARSQI